MNRLWIMSRFSPLGERLRFTLLTPGRIFLLVFFLVCISYSNTLQAPPVLDDITAFVENPALEISDLSVASLRQIAAGRFGVARFLPQVSFAMNRLLAHGSIVPFHLTNIAIHLGSVLALFFFLRALLRTEIGRRSLSGSMSPELFVVFACTLWALHPVQTNAVSYLVQRMTALAALFYLVSLTCYLEARLAAAKRRFLFMIGCAVAAIAAFFSKENSATLPLAILLVEWLFLSPDRFRNIARAASWRHWLLLAIALVVLLPLAHQPLMTLINGYALRDFTLTERLLTEARVLVFYLSLLLLPLPNRLNLDHDFSISTSLLTPPTTILSIILLAGLFIWGIRLRRRQPLLAFGIIWFFLQLAIESTIVPLELVFEHRLYLPSVGIMVAAASIIDQAAGRWLNREEQESGKIMMLVLVILAATFSLLTSIRNNAWQDRLAISQDCAEKSPKKARAIANYGQALAEQGQYPEALAVLEQALALSRPHQEEYVNAAANILMSLSEQGRFAEAAARGERYWDGISAQMNLMNLPRFMAAWGNSCRENGQFEDAFRIYVVGLHFMPKTDFLEDFLLELLTVTEHNEQARAQLRLDSGQAGIFLRMAAVMAGVREYQRADYYLEKNFELAPDSRAGSALRQKLQQVKELNLAAAACVLEKDPVYIANALFRCSMATVVFIEKYDPLLNGWPLHALLNRAEALASGHPFVGLFQARWQARQNGTAAGVEQLIGLLQRQPDFLPALDQLGRYYLDLGDRQKAATVFQQVLLQHPGHANWLLYENAALLSLKDEKAPLLKDTQIRWQYFLGLN